MLLPPPSRRPPFWEGEGTKYNSKIRATENYTWTPSHGPRVLAAIFAHFQQETAGLFYTKDIQKGDYCATSSAWVTAAYPCVPGKQYYGRGVKQLSWNYNYGAI